MQAQDPPDASPPSAKTVSPADVLDFWLSPEISKRWFTGGADLDGAIRQKFGAVVAAAQTGGLTDWEQPILHRLALVIVLDQFSRNIFRGKAQAFAGDARAQRLVIESLVDGSDNALPWTGRIFFYMPLMHAEDLARQAQSVRCFARLAAEGPAELSESLQGNLRYAEQHRDIIASLGRFPHRNSALGRTSTALEFDFLKNGPRFGQ